MVLMNDMYGFEDFGNLFLFIMNAYNDFNHTPTKNLGIIKINYENAILDKVGL